jgi:hypothetical protein
MFSKILVSAITIAAALSATTAFADNLNWNGLDTGGVRLQQKAPRSNGMHVRFAEPASLTQDRQVRFNPKANQVFEIEKSGNSRPVTGSNAKAASLKTGMTAEQARALNAQKKAASPKYQAYRNNQRALAEGGGNGARVRNGKVALSKDAQLGRTPYEKYGRVAPVEDARFGKTAHLDKGVKVVKPGGIELPKDARFGRTPYEKYGRVAPMEEARFGRTAHLDKGVRAAKSGKKVAKAANALEDGAKVAKTGRKLRTVGRLVTGGVATAAVGAALGVKVPDAVDGVMFAGKLVTDPKNAPKRLAGVAEGGFRMVGTAADSITDPGKMARNFGGAVDGVGRSVASTKVYKDLAKTRTGREIGRATSWTTHAVSKDYNTFKRTQTGRAIGVATKTVDKRVFKPLNKGVNTGMKTVGKGARTAGKAVGKTAKNVAKKLKFW